MKTILIIDGQGGGIGSRVITGLRALGMKDTELIAVGTNSAATAAMLKAGADEGATGENPAIYNSARADIIIGPIGIIVANALLGEITPKMAAAISSSDADKILIPFAKCSVSIAGVEQLTAEQYVKRAVDMVGARLKTDN